MVKRVAALEAAPQHDERLHQELQSRVNALSNRTVAVEQIATRSKENLQELNRELAALSDELLSLDELRENSGAAAIRLQEQADSTAREVAFLPVLDSKPLSGVPISHGLGLSLVYSETNHYMSLKIEKCDDPHYRLPPDGRGLVVLAQNDSLVLISLLRVGIGAGVGRIRTQMQQCSQAAARRLANRRLSQKFIRSLN